jgi:endonuclease/exonuclease/phosphatase (EEP) superfamily protein YafD
MRVSSFSLMTFNVEHDNAYMGATVAAIEATNADVVVLQEITKRWQNAVDAALGDLYPHRASHIHSRDHSTSADG